MSTFNISLTLEQVRVIQDSLEDKLDSYHESMVPPDDEEANEAAIALELFTEVFGPIIVSCRNIQE